MTPGIDTGVGSGNVPGVGPVMVKENGAGVGIGVGAGNDNALAGGVGTVNTQRVMQGRERGTGTGTGTGSLVGNATERDLGPMTGTGPGAGLGGQTGIDTASQIRSMVDQASGGQDSACLDGSGTNGDTRGRTHDIRPGSLYFPLSLINSADREGGGGEDAGEGEGEGATHTEMNQPSRNPPPSQQTPQPRNQARRLLVELL
jgi:hypothetical protein